MTRQKKTRKAGPLAQPKTPRDARATDAASKGKKKERDKRLVSDIHRLKFCSKAKQKGMRKIPGTEVVVK